MFGPDAEAKVFLSSADWMPRNFYRRVEVMFPIEQADLKDRILHEIVPAYLLDNVKSRHVARRRYLCSIAPCRGRAAISACRNGYWRCARRHNGRQRYPAGNSGQHQRLRRRHGNRECSRRQWRGTPERLCFAPLSHHSALALARIAFQ